MNTEEYEKRRTLATIGLETRLGKEEMDKFIERAEHESKAELSIVGAFSEEAFQERVLGRLERKLEHLVEVEREAS